MQIKINELKNIIKKEFKKKLIERMVSDEERIKLQKTEETPHFRNYSHFLSENDLEFLRKYFYDDVMEYILAPGTLVAIYEFENNYGSNQIAMRELQNSEVYKEIEKQVKEEMEAQSFDEFNDYQLNNFRKAFSNEGILDLYENEIIGLIVYLADKFDYRKLMRIAEEASSYFDMDGNLHGSYEKYDKDDYDTEAEEKFEQDYTNLSDKIKQSFMGFDLGDFALHIEKNYSFGSSKYQVIYGIHPYKAANVILGILKNTHISNLGNFKLDETDKDLDMYQGMIWLKKLTNPDCYGSYQTNYTAAQKGYGPKMYSIAASWVKRNGGNHDKITSDRGSVKSAARKVWEKTFKDRINDYNVYELDNLDYPNTDDPWDDCYLYSGNDETDFYLNHAYEIKNPLNYTVFESKFNLFLKVISRMIISLEQDEDLSIEDVEHEIKNFLNRNSIEFFSRKYSGR